MTTTTGAHRADASASRKSRKKWLSILPLLLVLAGVVVLCYPLLGTFVQNMQQSGAARTYTTQTQAFTAKEREEQLERARSWNAEHAGGPILDPWLMRVREDNPEYQAYLDQLALTDVMGRLVIPSIKSDLPVYHGTTEYVLNKGIGHLFGSSLPVGGEGTHSVFSAHTGLPHATLWDNLVKVKEGDAIFIDVMGQRMKYEVRSTEVVLPNEVDSLAIQPGKDLITLITCTPYGVNSHRLLVHAERVPYTPEDDEAFLKTSMPWQWWMTLVVVVVGAIALIALISVIRRIRRARSGAAVAERTSL